MSSMSSEQQTPVSDDPSQSPVEVDAQIEAADDAILAGAPAASATQGSAKDDEVQAGGKPADPDPIKPIDEPRKSAEITLSEDQRELLRRFHVDPEDLPANPDRRDAFIANLKGRHDDQARMFAELKSARETPAPPPPAPKPASDAWKPVAELLAMEDKDIGVLRAAIQSEMSEATEHVEGFRQQLATVMSMLYAEHERQGLQEVRDLLPDDVVFDETPAGIENRRKLMEEASPLLRANFDPTKFNLRHAITKAAKLAFADKLQLAERRRLQASAKKAAAGSPDASSHTSNSRPAPTQDEIDDMVLKAMDAGMTPTEIEEIAAGRKRI